MKRFGEFQLDAVNDCLWRGGTRLSLSPKAFKILNYIVENAGRIVTKDEFMEAIWPGVYVGEENLKIYVRELRSLLGDNAANPIYIETLRDKGYRFIAPLVGTTSGIASRHVQLFGRENELRKLKESFTKACNGQRQIVFVTGEPGIGKTTLLDTFLLLISDVQSVHTGLGQCIESYREQEAFYPILEAFGRLLSDPLSKEFGEVLRGQAPTWYVQFPRFVTSTDSDVLHREIIGAGRERMLREICEALETFTSQTPLVLVVEDLHWTDHSTLDFIAALARRREPAKLLLIATYRPVEVILADHPLRSLKLELCMQRSASEVELDFLDSSAVSDYLIHRFSPLMAEQLADDVHQKTDGNPLFVVELVDHLIDQKMIVETDGEWTVQGSADLLRKIVPDTLTDIIQRQVDQLSTQEQRLLTAASVIGQSFPTVVLADSLNAELVETEELCDSLSQRHLLLTRGGLLDLPDGQVSGLFQFTHALHRDVIYNGCRPTARLDLHRRVGETIEKIWKGQEHEAAAELTHHFEECRDYQRVVHYLRLQAENAEHRYAYQDAIALLELALTVAARIPSGFRSKASIAVRLHLGRLYDKLGEKVKATQIFSAIVDEATLLQNWDVAADSLISQSRQLAYSDVLEALNLAERAVTICHESHCSPVSRLSAEAWLSFLKLSWDGWSPELSLTLEESVAQLRNLGDLNAVAQLGAGVTTIQTFTGDHEGALKTSEEALPVLAVSGDALSHSSVRWMRSLALLRLGRLGESLALLQESLMLAKRNMNAFDTLYGELFLAELHVEAFSTAMATRLCEESLSRLSDSAIATQRGLIIAAMAYLDSGEIDRAGDYLSKMEAIYAKSKILVSWYWKLLLHSTASERWLALGEIEAARSEVETLRALASKTPNPLFRARVRQISARTALAEHKEEYAQQEVEEALGIVGAHDVPLVAWRVHETAARVYAHVNDVESASQHWKTRDQILKKLADSLPAESPLQSSIMCRIQKSAMSQA